MAKHKLLLKLILKLRNIYGKKYLLKEIKSIHYFKCFELECLSHKFLKDLKINIKRISILLFFCDLFDLFFMKKHSNNQTRDLVLLFSCLVIDRAVVFYLKEKDRESYDCR